MHDQQDSETSGHGADAVPTLLAIFGPIKDDGMQWVRKDDLGKREIEAVLDLVSCLLLRIPDEAHS
jgi:hypothetical protein